MDDEELEQGGQGDANRTGGRFNPATKVANGAKNVQNTADTVSKLAEQSSQKAAQKAVQQTGEKASKSVAKAASRKKMSQTAAKVATKAGKVAQVAAKLSKIMLVVGWILIILIAIIGILVFIITGFGFIIGGLQQIISGIGDWWAGWTGGQENIVKEEQMLDTLSYLEEMEYDLFGYGFITDEKAALETKEETDDDGNVTSTKKSLGIDDANDPAYNYIRTYLVSDNYSGIIKNSNKNLKEMFSSWGNFLSGCWGGTGWGSGLISIYYEGSGGIGTKGNSSNTSRIGKDLASVENGKLRITKSRISSTAWEYDLDGWIGRYGMPIEFLLATHIATMAPDLSLRMATSFDTDVEILLHKSNGGDVKSGIVSKDANLSTISDEQVLTAEDFDSFFDELRNWYKEYFSWLPTWIMDQLEHMAETYAEATLNAKDVMQIFRIAKEKGIDLVSPDSCQGPETEDEEIQGEKKTKMKNNSDEYSGNTELDRIRAEIKQEQVEEIIIPNVTSSGVNFTDGTTTDDIRNDLNSNIDSIKWYDENEDQKFNNDGTIAGNRISLSYSAQYDNKNGVLVIELYNGNWSATDENMYSTITFYYDNGEYDGKKCSEVAKEYPDEVEDGDIYACSKCKSYVKTCYKALHAVDDVDMDTYVPYINRVTDHWFRNVYFTKAGIDGDNIIETDNEYEKKTGERWTEYEMYTDDSGKEQYELYIYKKKPNGDYKTELENIVCRKVDEEKGNYKLSDDGVTYVKDNKGNYKLFTKNSSGKATEYNDDSIKEFRVGKKAITKSTNDLFAGKEHAYEEGEEQGSWEEMGVNEDSPSSLKEVAQDENIRLVYKASYPTVDQTEDGERGETNPTIKKLFLDDYYIYDGTGATAALIKKAKSMINSSNGATIMGNKVMSVDDPDTFKQVFGNSKKIKAEFDGKDYEATIDQISGPISLNHSSLTAFSILENMHTLDAEYIYHDFKELIVELNYFDKEDLTEAEEEVMMFPVAGVSGAGWPVVRYDKSEEFYGTLIHSATDLEARRAETEAELQELINAENGPAEDDEDVSNASKRTNSKEVEAVNGSGNTSYADDPDLTDAQKMILQAAEDVHYHLETNGFSYSLNAGDLKSTLEEATKSSKKLCCATFVGYVAQALGMDFTMSHGSLTVNENILKDVKGVEKIEVSGLSDFKNKLQPGDIVWRPRSGGQGHTQIFVGFDESGNFLWYNCGSSDSVKASQPYISTYDINSYQKIYRWTGCDISYNGMSASNSSSSEEQAEFAGFEGGEYVVAPVTGEVVKYGTVNRKNIETGEDNEVGFIKIRVLGSPECKPGKTCTRFGGSHTTVSSSDGKKYSKGKLTASDWLEDKYSEKKLEKLGYDYFWSEYNSAGIGDHYLYLEGFDVSDILGDGKHRTKDKDKNKEQIDKLVDYIKENEEANNYSTQYTVPNLLDDTREFELQVEEEAKKKAAYTITQGDKIYIKEGAVIGKTFSSDDENITKEQKIEVLKKNQDEDNDEVETKKKKYNIGNYMRIIFRDTDDEVVENVEDFVETGENKGNPIETEVSEKLLFFLGVLEEGGWGNNRVDGDYYLAVDEHDGAGESGLTTAFGLTDSISEQKAIKDMYPNFKQDIASGKVLKKEAQDVFVLTIEAAREAVLTFDVKEEQVLDALIDLYHMTPTRAIRLGEKYKSGSALTVTDFENEWGNPDKNTGTRAEALKKRAHNRGILATKGVWQQYNAGQGKAIVEFQSETPWSDFCQRVNSGENPEQVASSLYKINGEGE